jgi:peptidoglycan hydrolase-like protein with peptidoglycan-binding domain
MSSTLRKGDRGPEVARLQRMLNGVVRPPPHLREDGDFGAKTESAVKAFQSAERLIVDGIAGPVTMTRLSARFGGGTVALPSVRPGGTVQIPAVGSAPGSSGSSGTSAGAGAGAGASGGGTATGLLPARGRAARLNPGDFQTAATELGVHVAAVRAVAEVESGGRTGFDSQGRPKILFEAHFFHRLTGGQYDRTHPTLSQPRWNQACKDAYKLDQWTRMHEAMALNTEAAWKSASWGMFQVMGDNYRMVGWNSVRQFVLDMFDSEAMHMRAFLGYCKHANLIRHLKHPQNWAAFAAGYNGPGYAANRYDVKMAEAYRKYGGT